MFFNPRSDEKSHPVKAIRRTFQGKACHPCQRLSFWLHWHDQIFDIRTIRLQYGLPSETEADYALTKDEAFNAHVAQLRRLVGRTPFAEVIAKAERQPA